MQYTCADDTKVATDPARSRVRLSRKARARSAHSAFAPEARTTSPHFSDSRLMNAAKDDGFESAGSEPSATRRSRMAGGAGPAAAPRAGWRTISGGVFGGG